MTQRAEIEQLVERLFEAYCSSTGSHQDRKFLAEAADALSGLIKREGESDETAKSDRFMPLDDPSHAALKAENAHLRKREEELREALEGMKRAFCCPIFRRSIGGHNLKQQEAVLKASASLTLPQTNYERSQND